MKDIYHRITWLQHYRSFISTTSEPRALLVFDRLYTSFFLTVEGGVNDDLVFEFLQCFLMVLIDAFRPDRVDPHNTSASSWAKYSALGFRSVRTS